MTIKKMTPVLVVEAIEPNLPLWIDQLGFEKTVEVPHGDRLGFVILVKGATELMLQTTASLADDDANLAKNMKAGDVFLYAHISSLDEAKSATAALDTVVPDRETFYGAKEIFVKTGDGHVLGLAQHPPRE